MNKISIIIPSYGGNTNLPRAIESVLSQTYENMEAIVVDDNGCGSDQQLKNAQIMGKYTNDSRVKYIVHDKNRGGSAARNTGVQASTGEYIGFLDDDDEFDKDNISNQMKESETLDATWAGTYPSARIFRGNTYVRTVIAQKSGNFLEEYLAGKVNVTIAIIIKRDVFNDIGGFDESFVRHQDYEFISRLLDRYKLKAVQNAYFNRYYKEDVKNTSAEARKRYMDHYTETMKISLKSIPPDKLDLIFRDRYISIVCSFLRAKNYDMAHKIMKEYHYGCREYFMIAKYTMQYIKSRVKYGTHF